MEVRPHDLVWVNDPQAIVIESELPEWLNQIDYHQLPMVVRREQLPRQFVPVGIRGRQRAERLAVKIKLRNIIQVVTPESLINHVAIGQLPSHFRDSLQALRDYLSGWQWGITGSCGYQIASGITSLSTKSDLDLLIRCPIYTDYKQLVAINQFAQHQPCRIDIQIQTPYGGFVLNEWIREQRVLLRTATGPILTHNPWCIGKEY